MKLALHRSLAFWAGLLIFASACWGWWDSMRCLSVVTWSRLSVVQGGSGVAITYGTSGGLGASRNYGVWSVGQGSDSLVFGSSPRAVATILPAPLFDFSPPSYGVFLPFGLIFPILLPVWAILLMRRAKRRKGAIA